jgi:hypothetical protein
MISAGVGRISESEVGVGSCAATVRKGKRTDKIKNMSRIFFDIFMSQYSCVTRPLGNRQIQKEMMQFNTSSL